ncbi:MAG: hypothetical protein JW874_04855 [Spirochaetales bacterium]|nr:hypothetical protein [Spirochaetales bacterium]
MAFIAVCASEDVDVDVDTRAFVEHPGDDKALWLDWFFTDRANANGPVVIGITVWATVNLGYPVRAVIRTRVYD